LTQISLWAGPSKKPWGIIFFRHPLSYSSVRNRAVSDTVIPPYFALQLSRRIADHVLAPQIRRLHTHLMLARHTNDLILNKISLAASLVSIYELTYQWHDFLGAARLSRATQVATLCF